MLFRSALSYHLDRIVKRLSRQEHYVPIAETIVGVFQQLYGLDEGTILAKVEDKTSLKGDTEPLGDPGDSYGSTQTCWETLSPEESTRAMTLPPGEQSPKLRVESPQLTARDRTDLFALRLEIMRYANPLRAKILLLSTIRSPFTFTPQDRKSVV